MSVFRWVITSSWLSRSLRSFLCSSSVYFCHLFLISSASVWSILFLSFIVPIFTWNVPLVSLIFLMRSLVFPILLSYSISLHYSLKKALLSLLAIFWNSAFRWVYLSFSPLPSATLLFSAICKACSDSHFAFLLLFFLGMVLYNGLPLVQHHKLPFIFLQALCPSDLISWICHFHCIIRRIWLRSYLNGPMVFPTFFNLSLNLQQGLHALCHSQLQVLFLLTVWDVGQPLGLRPNNMEGTNPSHQEKIGLNFYWAWSCTSNHDPVSPTVSISHLEISISLLSLFIRGQKEWKPQSQKTNQTDHMDHSLV